jgi:hypothetical protein
VAPSAVSASVFLSQAYCVSRWPSAVSKLPPEATNSPWKPGRVLRIQFDYAAHFPSMLGGNVCGVSVHRLGIIRFNLGTEAGRAIVGERDAVNDELSLVF